MTRPLLLDVDTGTDDAVAIALASRLTRHDLVAITTVAGNVPIELAYTNTLRVVSWLGVEIPVYRGMSEPLVRPLFTAREHHGRDGLGGWQIPEAISPQLLETAPEAIVRLAREHRGEIRLVFVGPLTNLAVALSLEPRIVEWVNQLVIMGGAFFRPGNTTPYAEFNVYADPEAAAKVARSGMNVTWIPLDATQQATLTYEQWERLAGASDSGAVLLREVTRRTMSELGKEVAYLHDPLAVAAIEQPDVVQVERGSVTVDVSEAMHGRTRLAKPAVDDATHAVATGVDQAIFRSLLQRVTRVE